MQNIPANPKRGTMLRRQKTNPAIAAYNARYTVENPHKRAAGEAVAKAIRTGQLIRKPCEVCGKLKTDAHHDDYDKQLDVRWLCRKHHLAWHRNNNPISL